jgi:hypothetical protein
MMQIAATLPPDLNKLSLCLTKHYALTTCVGVDVTSALLGGEWSV